MLTAGAQIQMYGSAGTGKTTLVRYLAYELAGRDEDVVFLNAAGRDVDDLVPDLFDSCYDSTGYRPSPVELRRLMGGLPFNLIIDDLEVPSADLTSLLDAVPDARVVWTSVERTSWADGQALNVAGLARPAAFALVERGLDRPLDS